MNLLNRTKTPVLALGIAVLLLSAYAQAQMPPTRVVVAKAEMREAPATALLVGTVNPARRSLVGSEIEGVVESMPCRQGDLVEEGGVLCTLNDDTLSHQLEEAEARWQSLVARHDEFVAGTRLEELARLKASLDEATARHQRWEFEMTRVSNLYHGEDSNQREVYDTRAELQASKQKQAAAQAQYDEGVAGPRNEVVAQAAFDAAAQKAVVERIKSNLAKTVIRAPFTGFVVRRVTEVGEWISSGGSVVEMADLSTVLVRVDVPEPFFPYLAIGDPARVKVDALEQSFDGTIKHIIPDADLSARTFPMEIELGNSARKLAGGMFARATVTAGPKKKVLAVPKDALVEHDGVDYVAVAMPGEQGALMGMLTAVLVGSDVGEWVSVKAESLRPGSMVITRGTEQIMPFPSPIVIVDELGNPVPMPQGAGAAGGGGQG